MMEGFCSVIYVTGLSRCDIGKNDGTYDFIFMLNRHVCATGIFVMFPDDSVSGAELWLACSCARTDLLLATHRGWLQYCALSMPEKPTAACLVGSSVWLGDCIGQIHAYM
jgi:hypothetical protein